MTQKKSSEKWTQRKRHQAILARLEEVRELTVEEACQLFQASPATIRRDFNELTEQGEAIKTWGGCSRSPTRDFSSMPSFADRENLFVQEKQLIAKRAAGLVSDGEVVIIDGGTTTVHMARLIAMKRIRVVTNSLVVAHQIDLEKRGRQGAEVFLTGGCLYPNSGLLAGPQTKSSLKQYHADRLFLSAGGIDAEGATNHNEMIVEAEQTMIEQSRQTVVLADASKIGVRAMCPLCPLDKIYLFITNQNRDHLSFYQAVKKSGVEIQFSE